MILRKLEGVPSTEGVAGTGRIIQMDRLGTVMVQSDQIKPSKDSL
jgi:hypothetical protein